MRRGILNRHLVRRVWRSWVFAPLCCGRHITLRRRSMAHHGFTLPHGSHPPRCSSVASRPGRPFRSSRVPRVPLVRVKKHTGLKWPLSASSTYQLLISIPPLFPYRGDVSRGNLLLLTLRKMRCPHGLMKPCEFMCLLPESIVSWLLHSAVG